jgi:Tol biopolymer transport system component
VDLNLKQHALTRLTFERGADSYPVWSRDGRRVIYAGPVKGGDENLVMRAADGTGVVEVLFASDRHQTPYSLSPDGEWLVFRDEVPGHGTDLGIMRMRTREEKPLIATPFNERNAEISPDGKLLAYQSDETGTMEIYVRPFPNVDSGKKQISSGGGIRPVWSRDGRHLFYVTGMFPPISLNSVERRGNDVTADFGPVEIVFDAASYGGATMLGRTYDVAADGRFLMPRSVSDSSAAGLSGVSLILNWAAHLPTSR